MSGRDFRRQRRRPGRPGRGNPARGAVGRLNSAQRFLSQAPWMAIFAGLSIFVVVLTFNPPGDGLRDALDHKGR